MSLITLATLPYTTYQSRPLYLKDDPRLREDRRYEPDIIFCMSNATLLHKGDGLAHSTNLLKGPSVPPGYKVESLCDINVHDTMFVFWYEDRINPPCSNPPCSKTVKVDIKDLTKEIEFRTNSTVRGHDVYVRMV